MLRVAFLAIILLASISVGCARVRPWQREKLASPAMQAGFMDYGHARNFRAKVLESKTAGGLPGSAPGGGCGCTQ